MPLFQHLGKTINYTIENNGFREDVLFIHGNLASTRWWQPALELLSREQDTTMQGRLVTVDWIGCGKSSAPRSSEDLSMRSIAMDHISLVRSVGLTNIHLVGHSTGGLIGLYAMMLAPEMFSKLILLDPVSAEGIKFGPDMIAAFKQMSEDRGFCETVMSGTVHGRDPKDNLMQALIGDAFGVHNLIWTEIPKHLNDIDIRREIKRISQPTLVLHGELDQVLPEAGSREIAKLMPNARFEQLKGRGHSANVEDPALFVNKMKEFFL